MYDINMVEIEKRFAFIPVWERGYHAVLANMHTEKWDSITDFAQERILHLAIEMVTDVASYLIDGFIMRDAGSYEDIIEIMRDEKVVSHELAQQLTQLVNLKRGLNQGYLGFGRGQLHPCMVNLDAQLMQFQQNVRDFLAKPI